MIFINMSKNIFEKIRDGEEPSEIVYKDEFRLLEQKVIFFTA